MRAMLAKAFGGYADLKLTDLPKPTAAEGRLLVRVTAAGVTPLDHTILSGHFPLANPPLVLGNEGAGIVEAGGDAAIPDGTRVMFTGPYGVFENGTYSDYIPVKKEHVCVIPDAISDTVAGGLPIAYLTAYLALSDAGFEPGKSVLAPAIGGSIGNAVTQLARAMGAKHAISTTTNPAKAGQAQALGFAETVDLSKEGLADGVRRLTDGNGVDIVIDGIGGEILSEALGVLAQGGSLTTLGYSASRQSTIDVTHLIWKGASIKSFLLFSKSPADWAKAWAAILPLLASGKITPIVAKVYPLEEAAAALRYLVEDRPFGRVIVTP